MRILLLTVTALVAFAANSILNRAALAGQDMDPAVFTAIRLVSGAAVLAALAAARGGSSILRAGTPLSAAALLVYAVFFSFAYVTLDTGLGALLLFGGVQITMFGGALLAGQRPGPYRWAGSAMGLAGLAVLFLPGAAAPDPLGAAMMLLAAAGWGVYSLRGARAGDPLATTAGNFVYAAPVALALMLAAGDPGAPVTGTAVALAVASGAAASGLGYAIWYAALPALDASLAAVAQLTVPLIALAGGIVLLGESASLTFALAAALILGGVALAVRGPRRVQRA
ncbi:EamA family transporter [Rhodobacteraceae bacterium 2CG4]|uniref:EamA family transporter n=2 Tax=Halovulum marinum TaxID=2662447 RepID=A0A6L5YZF1_9RHOB|nr:EamA family transporter [Halovulum marinum]